MPKKKPELEIQQLRQKISIKNIGLTEKQKDLVRLALDDHNKIIFISGPAGSTKTFMAVYSALKRMKADDQLDLLYVRTVIESAEKGMGALPGDIDEKFNPYMAPLDDKLRELLPRSSTIVSDMIHKKRIQAMPVNFLRGASWTNKIVIADEAQNFTYKELTTLMTRLGEGSKLIICGDPMQSDINGKSGFADMYSVFNDEESKQKGIHTFYFGPEDIKRSEILKYVISKIQNKKV